MPAGFAYMTLPIGSPGISTATMRTTSWLTSATASNTFFKVFHHLGRLLGSVHSPLIWLMRLTFAVIGNPFGQIRIINTTSKQQIYRIKRQVLPAKRLEQATQFRMERLTGSGWNYSML
jgi:hypothetical protein